ncbi:hypothetical protein GCM10007989_29100 [Devosia pacifica]|uniref:Uncharacterized protein n=1 Tax=Devosia pacifica TaxID=1335967 RepID=A0A918SA66_9HYPH|nr:hypothetical protein [Devosia pacifica]GHA31300.1 hypothetical protein GCM10007989_29100 [Devosia pacifica]
MARPTQTSGNGSMDPPKNEHIEPSLETADTPTDEMLKAQDNADPGPTPTSPASWWLYGLIGLAVVVVILFAMQAMTNAPGTAVEPGSPTSAPVSESVE